MFVCLEFIVQLEIFHSDGEVSIAGEGLQILTYARHSWPLSSEGSLTCHTHCDTGLLVISEDPWHSHLLPSVWQWSCHYLFLRLRSVSTGDRIRFSDIKKSYLLSETKQSVFNVKIFLFLDIRKSNKNCIIKKLNVLYQGST